MFKGSGTMRLMNDKELLMKIWNVYDALNLLKELIDEHNKLKRDFMVKEISLVDMDKEGKIERNIIPMYDFYKKTGSSDNLLNTSEVVFKSTQELYLKLMMMQLDISKLKVYEVTDEDLDKYVGVYSSGLIPVKLSIIKSNKQLFGQLPRQVPFPLYAIAENKFEAEGFIFEFNPNDKTMKAEKEGEIFNLVKEE